MWFLFLACSGGTEENASSIGEKSTEQVETATKMASIPQNITVTENQIAVQLPDLIPEGARSYCFIQAMPDAAVDASLDVGMVGLSFQSSAPVKFIRLRGLTENGFNPNVWTPCEQLGGSETIPIYEVTGVDLGQVKDNLFNGFNWFSLPQNVAFGFPGQKLWYFEVLVDESSRGAPISISTQISTISAAQVDKWAGVIDISKMQTDNGSKHYSMCSFEEDFSILSVFGHSEPTQGTWTVECAEQELSSLDAALFQNEIPPLKNFDTPINVKAGEACSLMCDWQNGNGEICLASLVVMPLKRSIVCTNGLITAQ